MSDIRRYMNILNESDDARPAVVGDPGVVAESSSKEEVLVGILRDAKIYNEDGEIFSDFTVRNRDALDFGSVSIWAIEKMLNAAYDAGKASSGE